MNSIEIESSGDLSGLEPGTSLANAIGEQISNETIQSHTDSEKQSLNEIENRKSSKTKNFKEKKFF
jgi:hypothetical protein